MCFSLSYLEQFLIEAAILFTVEFSYIHIAKKLHFHEKVTPRSSHSSSNIIKSAGFIFFIGFLSAFIFLPRGTYNHAYFYPEFVFGAIGLAVISLIDDFRPLDAGVRLTMQVLFVAPTYYELVAMNHEVIYILAVICAIGFMNAYNFMDGINGMLASYSIVSLTSLAILYSPYLHIHPAVATLPYYLCISLATAVGIFAIFNFRKHAICFSGDIGSIILGFLIGYITVCYGVMVQDPSVIILFAVYGIETVFTIFYRISLRENILTSHRRHLYQIMANENKQPHLKVSISYAAVQLAINAVYIAIPDDYRLPYSAAVIILLSIAFLRIRSNFYR